MPALVALGEVSGCTGAPGYRPRSGPQSMPRAVSVMDHGAVGDGVADDTAALAGALEAAHKGKSGLYLPAGSYRVTAAVDWREEGLHAFGDGRNRSIVRQARTNTPIVMLGEQQQHVHDLSFHYENQAATSDTGSVAIQLYKPSYSAYERLATFWAHKGIGLYLGDYDSATDRAGGNYAFSNTWRDIEILGHRSSGIDLTSYRRASTGSVWENVYVRNGPVGPAERALTYPVLIRDCDEQIFNQLNIESVICDASDVLFVQGSSVVINGLHLEGITLSQWNGALVQAYDVGTTQINMMTVQGSSFPGGRNNKAVVKVGLNARVRVQGLTLRNSNRIQSAVFALLQSLDQTGTFSATEVDLSAFTVRTLGDTGVTPVTKQINEMTAFVPLTRP